MIKGYAWEIELKATIKSNSNSMLRFSGILGGTIVLFIKSYRGGILEAGPAFTVFAAFSFLAQFLGVFVGYSITTLAELKPILKRMTDILLLQQKDDNYRLLNQETGESQNQGKIQPQNHENIIQLINVDLSWGQDIKAKINQIQVGSPHHQQNLSSSNLKESNIQSPNKFDIILRDISLQIKEGELIAVIGKVCSGKSTLLHAFMGQNFILKGEIHKKSGVKFCYVEQQPFILSDSVKQNITFGLQFNQEKFNEVCRSTCMEQDLEQLVHGKDTEIGQKGVNLSGGQKARVSLSRAIYSQADIYLLDDPLSAVDPKVASKIMDFSIKGKLENKTRILVTHQLHILSKVDRILYLQDGELKFNGTYDQLQKTQLDLSNILQKQGQNKIAEAESIQQQKCIQQSQLRIKQDQKEDIDNDLVNDDNTDGKQNQQKNYIEAESKSRRLSCKNLCKYTRYSCGICTIPLILFLSIALSFNQFFFSQWIKIWVSQTDEEQQKSYYRNMFLLIALCYLLILVIRNIILMLIIITQSSALFKKMLSSIVRAKVSFFDANPVGRILNRFSKDISSQDIVLPQIVSWFLEFFFRILSILIVLCIAIPYATIFIAIFLVLIILIRNKVLHVTRQSMRLQLQSRSPIATVLSSTLSGLVSIRAYNKSQYFKNYFNDRIQISSRAFITFQLLNRSFGFYLDCVVIILILSILYVSFAIRTNDNVLLIVLAIQLNMELLNYLQITVRLSSDIQTYTESVNRCFDYANLESEAPLFTHTLDKKSRKKGNKIFSLSEQSNNTCNWINQGEIQFRNVILRYRPDLPAALNDFSIHIKPMMKVGIVGRTGAGKSSIIQTVFRMIELNDANKCGGSIIIDGKNIADIGLHDLRKNISIIPQTPFLFQGTIRQNLNPLSGKKKTQQEDERIFRALEDVQLDQYINSLQEKLDTVCSDANSVFSAGQKQLLCLARAILNENKILVMDQATANVDMATDKIIQETIRRKFNESTVLIIAHRIATIIDSDLIIVMKEGRCIESGHPFELLGEGEDSQSITRDTQFASMKSPESSKFI